MEEPLTINVDLTKEDLVCMVNGCSPSYKMIEHPAVKTLGNYTGGFVDRWDWDTSALKTLSIKRLWTLYTMCRDAK